MCCFASFLLIFYQNLSKKHGKTRFWPVFAVSSTLMLVDKFTTQPWMYKLLCPPKSILVQGINFPKTLQNYTVIFLFYNNFYKYIFFGYPIWISGTFNLPVKHSTARFKCILSNNLFVHCPLKYCSPFKAFYLELMYIEALYRKCKTQSFITHVTHLGLNHSTCCKMFYFDVMFGGSWPQYPTLSPVLGCPVIKCLLFFGHSSRCMF